MQMEHAHHAEPRSRIGHGLGITTDAGYHVEQRLDMVAGIRRDPEAVAYAAARFGMMRMFHLHGRAAAMGFAERCIETAEIATDLSQL